MTEWLRAGAPLPRGTRKAAARRLHVTVRTLRNYEKRVAEGIPLAPLGRRRIPEADRARVLGLVLKERGVQGDKAGFRPILAALRRQGERVWVTLVQEALEGLKAEDRRREREERARWRVSVRVLARDVIWGGDSTHLGRVSGDEVKGEILKDRASLATVACSAGPAATEEDVIALFDAGARERGTFPLVWQRDNGAPYFGKKLARYLADRRIVVLRSRPRTPTDNAATERAIRDVKEASGLGCGVVLASAAAAEARLGEACGRLDSGLLRGSRGYRTARELDQELPRWYPRVDRDEFYRDACAVLSKAVLGPRGARAQRAAEREAILVTLEKWSLIERTRGARPEKAPGAPESPSGSTATRQDAPGTTIGGVGGPVGTPLLDSGLNKPAPLVGDPDARESTDPDAELPPGLARHPVCAEACSA